MRIVHIVTFADPEGSLGGPLRVACNQIAALRARGHNAFLVAGARDFGPALPQTYSGVPARLFPVRTLIPGTGFAGLSSPSMLRGLKDLLSDADVAHIHLARDLVQLPAALRCRQLGIPYIAQTHGMIDESDSPLAPPLDRFATRPALRSASRVLALTHQEKGDLLKVDPTLDHIDVLPNGVPDAEVAAVPNRDDAEVLFLARMAPRKRPQAFVSMAQQLAQQFPKARFTLIGPDEGEVGAVKEMLAKDNADGRIHYEGSTEPQDVVDRLARSAIYVLPAEYEPFGMTVVEAMSVGLPTAVMSDCGLADSVRATGGVVASNDEALAAGVSRLLADPQARVTSGEAGRRWVREHFGMSEIARRLETVYTATTRPGTGRASSDG